MDEEPPVVAVEPPGPLEVTAGHQKKAPPLPPCPITGRPARRRIQKLSVHLIRSVWRYGLAIDVDRLFQGIEHLGLYESECGLVFFHPAIQGDESFYSDFYRRVRMHPVLNSGNSQRAEFQQAARHIPPGMAVLDVGCGHGGFRHHVPEARYRGLDPFAPAEVREDVLRERLECHVERYPEAYDAVTAFQVIEHVAEPKRFVESMLRALRPGGHLILCAPLHRSAMTEIPNFLLNAVPHHLTWWNPRAFAALAQALDLEIVEIMPLPPSPHEGIIHWMNRVSFCKPVECPNERYFGHRWSWHLNLGWSYGIAKLLFATRRLPGRAQPVNLLLAARKPS